MGSWVALLVLVVVVGVVEGWWPREYPRIGLNRWLELDAHGEGGLGRWRSDFDNMTKSYLTIKDQGQTYVVSSQVTGLGIECNATYPVQWVARYQDEGDYYSFYSRVHYLRSNPDVFNPRSNTFTAQLDLYGEQSGITGNYSCVAALHPNEVAKSIYVYWQGTNPSNLVLGGKTVDVQSRDGRYLILPCRVSRPDVTVNLYKELNSEWNLIKSPFIKFNPKFGFRINLYQYNGAYGRFKCAVSDDEDEAVIINALKGIAELDSDFNNTMEGNATLFFNKTTQEIVCCSNSSRAPKLHTLFCVENFACDIRRHQLHTIVNNGRRSKTTGCTMERVFLKDAGLLRCAGDGIDVLRNFYTDLPTDKNNHSSNLYFNWGDILGDNMASIYTTSRGRIYEGQNVTVACDTAFNYFSDGMKWAIRWRNHSLKFFPSPPQKPVPGVLDVYESSLASFQSLRIQVSRDIIEVLCFVPVWNDTAWVNKSLLLDVQETKGPSFSTPLVEVVQWALNSTEKLLECRVMGSPTPTVKWKKNNKTILHENNLGLRRINGTATLVIHRVSHDVQGDYRCIANNFGGTVEKKFLVYVQGPSSGLGLIGGVLLATVVLVFGAGVVFLVWKLQLQRRVISHLSSIVFRDVNAMANSQQETSGTITTNFNSISNNAGIGTVS